MRELETSLGGDREAFPETVWSSLLAAAGAAKPERLAAMNDLASLYWRPVYRFIRIAGGSNIENSKDLTQEFFGYLLESDVLARYDRAKGRFRTYLKGVLRHFLSVERRDASRQKRGGGRVVLSLDVADLEGAAGSSASTPEEAFDRQWAEELIAESLAELRRKLQGENRELSHKLYEAYHRAGAAEAPTYASLGKDFGLGEQQVKDHLAYARGRLERILRDRLARRVTSAAELSDELGELLFG